MENQMKNKKFWKPQSFEDSNVLFRNKKIKLDPDENQKNTPNAPKEVAEPKTVKELATHPKKIEEVKNWLKRNMSSRAPMLFITGPAGCGKTTTLKVLANEEGIQIREWINPINKTEYKAEAIFQSEVYDRFSFSETSQSEKFDDFIFRSSRYNSLFGTGKTALILVKDIPNIFIWRPKSFHEFLEKYKSHGKSPIVFILTDDQNLLPNHVRIKHNITNIKFNSVNHTLMMKILRTCCDFYCPEEVPLQFLEGISRNSGGDLRSATNDLMLFLRTSGMDLNSKSKKDGLWGAATKLLSLKNINFDFYHVIGRILNPKLLTEMKRPNCVNPNQILLHDVQKVADYLSGSYLCILHENYIQTFTKLQDVVDGADCFSFCDILGHHQELEDCRSLVAVITLMLKNTTPVGGFNQIKRSFRFEKTNTDCNRDVAEHFNYELCRKDLLLDVLPFLKFLNIRDREKKDLTDVSEDHDASEDMIEIEEFDD